MIAAAATVTEIPYRLIFMASPGDRDQERAATATGHDVRVVPWEPDRGDFARKANLALHESTEPWLFVVGDDACFCPGWATAALEVAARERVGVVGTNDRANPRVIRGETATHNLVARWYAERHGTVDAAPAIFDEGYDHNYCNPPEAPIWMADLSFRPLGDVRVGEDVIGWRQSDSGMRALCYSRITRIQERHAPLVHVGMESGRHFICTPDHRWLNAWWAPSLGSESRQWVTPEQGRLLLHVASEPPPVPAELERTAGWIAGIYDGEGSGIVIATQSFAHNPAIVEAITRALDLLDVPYRQTLRKTGVAEFVLQGGRQAYLDFLLRIEPERRESLAAHVVGWREAIGARRFGRRDRIVSVTPAGEGTVFSMTTTSGNYVAWGYASKNCDDELVETARARSSWAFAADAWVPHLHPMVGQAIWDPTYAKGHRQMSEDAIRFADRRQRWRRLDAARPPG